MRKLREDWKMEMQWWEREDMEGLNHQVINISNIVVCAISWNISGELPCVSGELLSVGCSVVYNFTSRYISVHCLSWICFISLGLCHTLEILGDGFLEMDGHWWSCLHMIFILYFETIKGWFILKVKIPSEMEVALLHKEHLGSSRNIWEHQGTSRII